MRLETAVPADVLAAIRAPFLNVRAETIDAPVLQPLGLLLDLAGEAMRERLYVVQAEGGAESCLRPDFTIPVALAHLESGKPRGRYLYEGKAFRVSPDGEDRAEEFLQIGLEAYEAGEPPRADAEIAALAWNAALAGGRDDLILHFGDVSLFGAFIDALGLALPLALRLKRAFSQPRKLRAELARADGAAQEAEAKAPGGERLATLLVGLGEAEAAGVLEDLWALAGIPQVGGRSAAEIVHRLAERAALARAPNLTPDQAALINRYLAISAEPEAALDAVAALAGPGRKGLDAALKDWALRLEFLADDGPPASRMRLTTAFGREFAYYDGVLFEVRSAALGDGRAVAAGGRYDGLPARLGATRATGAVGCMIRPARAWKGGKP